MRQICGRLGIRIFGHVEIARSTIVGHVVVLAPPVAVRLCWPDPADRAAMRTGKFVIAVSPDSAARNNLSMLGVATFRCHHNSFQLKGAVGRMLSR
jgi:hypothetical protein